jgi:hypothetical protein
MAQELGGGEGPMRWTRSTAFSAFVHLAHSAAIFTLTLFVRAPAGRWLQYAWCVGAFFSLMALLLLLRVGSYEGTTDEEVGRLIRQGYWVATVLYLCLLAASLFFLLRAG